MSQSDPEFGQQHPNAPAELSLFAFLVGEFDCEARVLSTDGSWQTFRANWVGQFILDGFVIADEYLMTNQAGAPIVHGINIRSYDPVQQEWNMKWLDARRGTWTELGPEALGGVTVDCDSIIYAMEEPMAGHVYTQATYTNISDSHFTWRGERSDDGQHWEVFLVVEAHRI